MPSDLEIRTLKNILSVTTASEGELIVSDGDMDVEEGASFCSIAHAAVTGFINGKVLAPIMEAAAKLRPRSSIQRRVVFGSLKASFSSLLAIM